MGQYGFMALDIEKLLEIYRRMLLVRTIEETHDRFLKEGSVEGACWGVPANFRRTAYAPRR